nr:putative carbohydrate binding domain containing protein [uncultured Mediterranean phage uvMED]
MSITKVTDAGLDRSRIVTPIIINGDMQVAQRATSVTSHNAVSYTTVDRFKTVCETGTYTVIQESLTSGNAYLNGFKKALRLDTTTAEASAGSAGEQTTIEQRIEGQNLQQFLKGTANAKPFTLAFWVKASKTGSNLQVNLRDGDNTRQVGGTYNIDAADTWEKKVINFPADTTGAFDNDNAASLTIEWFLDGGSNYSGGAVPTAWEASSNADRNVTNFDLAGSTDNDWALTGVQLEVGTFDSNTIPSFPFESFENNFRKCQRYLFKHNPTKDGQVGVLMGFANGGSDMNSVTVPVPVPMRANPSLSTDPASGSIAVRYFTPEQGTGTISSYTTLASQGDCASDGSGYLALTLNGFGGNLDATSPNGIEFESTSLIMDAEL